MLAAAASLALAGEARACSCISNYVQWQPCGAYWRSNVVFAGTVVEVGPATPVEGSGGKVFTSAGRATRFRVVEAFRGLAGDTVETFEEGTSCDYHFKPGGATSFTARAIRATAKSASTVAARRKTLSAPRPTWRSRAAWRAPSLRRA